MHDTTPAETSAATPDHASKPTSVGGGSSANVVSRRSAMAAGVAGAVGVLAAAASGVDAQRIPPRIIPEVPDVRGLVGCTSLLTPEELGWHADRREYVLPDLPYAYDALDDAIDEQTMRIHHTRHHAGYIRGLNNAVRDLERANGDAAEMRAIADDITFNGSGVFNHSLFWITMAPSGDGGGGEPEGELASALNATFGSFASFRTAFTGLARSVRGSGWAWLCYEPVSDRLMALAGHNQEDSVFHGTVPLLGIDVWEHAYYLRYQNERGRYIDNWWSVVNWPMVDELLGRVRTTG